MRSSQVPAQLLGVQDSIQDDHAPWWTSRHAMEGEDTLSSQTVMEDHHFTIADKKWLWRYSPLKGQAVGWTEWEKRKVLIHSGLKKSRTRLEVELHEGLHASLGPAISEETVSQTAYDLSRILYSLGYRLTKKD